MTTLDTTPFTALPRLSLGRMLELGEALVRLSPKLDATGEALSPKTIRSAVALEAAVTEARTASLDRMDEDREAAQRPLQRDIRWAASNAWYALRDFLRTWRRFDPEVFPQSAEAAQLEWMLVGREGWDFVRRPFSDQWLHTKMLLIRMEREELDRRIDALLGPAVMAEIRRTFEDCRHLRTGMMDVQERRTHLRRVREGLHSAVRIYLLRMVNEVADAPSEHEAQWLHRALAPVPAIGAEVRRTYRRRAGTPEVEPPPEAPLRLQAEVRNEGAGSRWIEATHPSTDLAPPRPSENTEPSTPVERMG